MTTRRSTRLSGEPLPTLPDNTNDKPIRPKRDSIAVSSSVSRITRDVPGTEYVSDFRMNDCESDSDGLKGEVFAKYVYNQLKNIDSEDIDTIPNAYIMMGPPGSGKSTVKRQFNIRNYVNIDLDEIKKILLKCFPEDRSIKGFGIIHQLKRIAKYLLETAIREKINILFDTTGRMKDIVTEVINSTSQNGYEINVIIISTSRENCLQRAEMRNTIETDREPMTSDMVNGAYDSFMDPNIDKGTLSYYLISNPDVLSHAKELYIFDNNGSSPELLFKKVGENVEVAANYPNFYNMSIKSSPPYFSIKRKGGRRTKRRKNKRTRTKRRRY